MFYTQKAVQALVDSTLFTVIMQAWLNYGNISSHGACNLNNIIKPT